MGMVLNHEPERSRHVRVLRASFGGRLAEWRRIVIQSVTMLTVPLTVAVHRTKKPFIYAGFNNLMTDETQMGKTYRAKNFICVSFVSICGF